MIATISDRGFGFIHPDGADGHEGDVYFHGSVVVGVKFDTLRLGQVVSYETAPELRNAGRMRATRVIVQA
jgi:cold shock CspA family protein